jgi:hypothetical protein
VALSANPSPIVTRSSPLPAFTSIVSKVEIVEHDVGAVDRDDDVPAAAAVRDRDLVIAAGAVHGQHAVIDARSEEPSAFERFDTGRVLGVPCAGQMGSFRRRRIDRRGRKPRLQRAAGVFERAQVASIGFVSSRDELLDAHPSL